MKAKGIPHPSGPFPYLEEVRLKLGPVEFDLAIDVLRYVSDPHLYDVPSEFIQQRLYVFEDEERKEMYFARHINYKIIQRLMQRKGTMTAYFGGMKKTFGAQHEINFLSITPTVSQRMPCSTDWWTTRCQRDLGSNEFSLTLPKLYEGKRGFIDYRGYLHLTIL